MGQQFIDCIYDVIAITNIMKITFFAGFRCFGFTPTANIVFACALCIAELSYRIQIVICVMNSFFFIVTCSISIVILPTTNYNRVQCVSRPSTSSYRNNENVTSLFDVKARSDVTIVALFD